MRAILAGTAASLLLVLAIVLGSRLLREFHAALLPYAVATVLLAFGVAYRGTVRFLSPGARRLSEADRHGCFLRRNLGRAPGSLPRAMAAYFGFQALPRAGSRARRAAYQLVLWGCVLAVLITFPLAWGWVTFTADSAAGPGYEMRIWGMELLGFDALGFFGSVMFRGLDLAAVLVVAGASYLLWRQKRDCAVHTGQRFACGLVPLVALVVVSVTGLLLPFSSLFLHGGGYRVLAIGHTASVVFTLGHIAFGTLVPRNARPRRPGPAVPGALPVVRSNGADVR